MDKVEIFGVKIDNTTLDESKKLLDRYLDEDGLKVIYTPNTEIVMAAKDDEKLKELINSGDLIVADGVGLIYASKLKKKPLKERVTGFDLSMELLELGNKNSYSIYLLGGKEGVAKLAGENIKKKYPGIEVLGCQNGFFKGCHIGEFNHNEEKEVIQEINNLKPDIIFVGLGFPRQEIWIDTNKNRLDAKVVIGNGGVMDILSGKSKRAPMIYQKLGLEWLYRLIKDPSRIKRQLVLPKFIVEVIFGKNVIK